MELIAVKFEHAYKKSSSGEYILNNLQMSVKSGIIYGVLGASGCGKTTMLSCILDIKRLDSGSVSVSPGKIISYMPQDIGLYESFTISETLHYFGKLNFLKTSQIFKNSKMFLSILKLDDQNKKIDSMSGGEKRRVSLAVALLNNPSILILDEPTVGLDPLIRENIWKYLQQLVHSNGTTIILTTHYVEEAKDCDMVSFMSNGRLLVEDSPHDLLVEHETNFLEDVFHKLYKEDMTSTNVKNIYSFQYTESCFQEGLQAPRNRDKSKLKSTRNLEQHFQLILTLLHRNFLLLWRDPLVLFLVLALPPFHLMLDCIVFSGQPTNIPFGIVNEEVDDIFLCDDNTRTSDYNNEFLSCSFLDKFPLDLLQMNRFKTEENALDCIISGNCLGYLRIPKNFTNEMHQRMLFGNFASNETLVGSSTTFKMDNTEHLKIVFLRQEIYKVYMEFLSETVSKLGMDPRMVEIPLKFNTITHEGSFIEFLQYPVVILLLFLTPMKVGWIYLYDKKSGILDRTTIAGVNFLHLLTSHFLCELLIMSLQISLTMGIQEIFFNLKIHGSVFLLFALTLTIGVCAFSFGMLFGLIWEKEIEVLYVALIIYIPTMISAGSVWPREGVEYWAKIIYNSLPAALPIEASRSIVSRGFGITNSSVWPGFVVPIIWIIINSFVGWAFKRRR